MINLPIIEEVSIDLSTICQLRCVECSTSKGITHNGVVGKGQFSYENFIKFVNENPQIKKIEMSNWGEIFLNKEIAKIIKSAFEHNITLCCGNGTNFNTVSEEVLEYIVKYRVEFLNISIDGASQETYEQYRICGNIQNVFKNIERLNKYKKKYKSEYPKLSWQFIIFGHNEKELPIVKALCEKYDMAFNPKLNYSAFSPVINKEFVRKESGLGVADRKEYRELHNEEYKAPCYHCFSSPQINWNGDILGCCVNKWKTMGSIQDITIEQWEQSNIYKELVDILFKSKECSSDIPCYYCPNYEKIKSEPLTIEGLQHYKDYIPPALRKR